MDWFNLLYEKRAKGGEKSMMEDIAISLKDISLLYPKNNKGIGSIRELITGRMKKQDSRMFTALSDINLEISKGSVVGIIGPNGSGKSTLLRVIAGIYAPDTGAIQVQGRPTLLVSVGTGFQQDLTGRENIYLTGSIYGFSMKEMRAIEHDIIEFSGIEDFINDPMRTYSAGMRARLGFSIISNLKPEILLLDEVMSVGDYEFRKKSRARIDEMVQSDATVVIVSHSKSILTSICDKVYALSSGKIVTSGDIDEAFEFYESDKE